VRVYLSADIEGTAGITHWNEADKSHPDYAEFRELMTAEVAAACEGAAQAGARDIVIKDAHSTGRNLILAKLPERVRIVRGWSGHPYSLLQEIDGTFDAVLLTGYHAKAGSDGNPLSHTMSGRVHGMSINGEAASEFTLAAYMAGALGIPVVFLSGDRQICEDATRLIPAITVVAVSEGRGASTTSVTPARSVAMIREGARQALTGDIARCRVAMPDSFELEIDFTIPEHAYRSSWYPGARLAGSRSVGFAARDFLEVMRAIEFLLPPTAA
jgi:D-amino peptidase